MAPAAIQARGLRKSYGGRAVLAGLDLDVRAGEALAVLGPNGSGKTTLLRILAGLVRPDRGTLRIGDAAYPSDDARRQVSSLLQEAPLYAEFTPSEHLAWYLWAQGAEATGADVEARLADAGLGGAALRHPVGRLSRGQRQRLALAMALGVPRPVLALDEPFTALDDAATAWLVRELQARRGHCTLVLALHDEALARRLCDRAVRLGTPSTLAALQAAPVSSAAAQTPATRGGP